MKLLDALYARKLLIPFHDHLVIHLFWISVILRLAWLDVPNQFYMGDEQHFVPAVLQLLYYGNFVDKQHPPLALPLLSIGVLLFRNTAWGWRIMPVIFGSACIPIFYLLTKRITNPKTGFIATFLFSFENLIFQLSRIAMIDIFLVFFTLLGFYLYFRGNYRTSALSLGLGLLCKQIAIMSVVALAAYHIIAKAKKKALLFVTKYLIFLGCFTFISWWVLDWTFHIFNNPIEHIQFFIKFYSTFSGLTHRGLVFMDLYAWQFFIPLAGTISLWGSELVGYSATGELVILRVWSSFNHVTNPAIIILIIPAFAYLSYKYWKIRDKTSVFAIIWFLSFYLPFLIPSLLMNIAWYLYYFAPLIPPVCLAIAIGLTDLSSRARIGFVLLVVYLAIVLVAFAYFCPFKSIPPTPL